jgi:hypothetical protein
LVRDNDQRVDALLQLHDAGGTRLREPATLVDEAITNVDVDDASLVGAGAVKIIQEWNVGCPAMRQADS